MHALAHPIGGLLDSHHGLTIAIVMPYVLERNRAGGRGAARSGSAARSAWRAGAGVLDWVAALRRELEIPLTLAALGMRAEHVPMLAPRAAADPSAGGNPVALDEADYATSSAARSGRLAACAARMAWRTAVAARLNYAIGATTSAPGPLGAVSRAAGVANW